MEKLRSEKLRDCGIMIQKHVKGILIFFFQKQTLNDNFISVMIGRVVPKNRVFAFWVPEINQFEI